MEEAEFLEPYQLSYHNLTLLADTTTSTCLPEEDQKSLDATMKCVMETLGPTGPGLLSVTGVPNASLLRQNLLPFARKLALVSPKHRSRILKENSMGSDVPLKNPNRKVSSFATQLKYGECIESTKGKLSHGANGCMDFNETIDQNDFKNFGKVFKELGFRMMELGLSIARVCDRAIGGRELEQTLLESSSAKGRLIHYHSDSDNPNINQSRTNAKRNPAGSLKQLKDCNLVANSTTSKSYDLWQQWHYDYGIFTVLTDPMFFLSSPNDESTVPIEDSCLQIYHPSKNKVMRVKASPESFIIQVGESADILSKGKLCSTLHSVGKLPKLNNVSRETFAVFLQPAWSKTFSISDYCMELGERKSGSLDCHGAEVDSNNFGLEIQEIVPPLLSRLKDGMTFSEFSRETTKQYYGGSGLQAKK